MRNAGVYLETVWTESGIVRLVSMAALLTNRQQRWEKFTVEGFGVGGWAEEWTEETVWWFYMYVFTIMPWEISWAGLFDEGTFVHWPFLLVERGQGFDARGFVLVVQTLKGNNFALGCPIWVIFFLNPHNFSRRSRAWGSVGAPTP